MIHVDTSFCPKLERRCEDSEYNVPNHLLICHRFAEEQRCLVPEQRRQFCIDRYEYPNRAGAHPPVMVSWFDAQATCEARGKRLCWSGEWTAACEGPERTPFPYGRARDNTKCNIDNTWIDPRLRDLYAKDPRVAQRELSRLDQSAPSGAVEGCVSGFGVHDMTGNFDEWVTSEEPPSDKSQWAGLKGGAWGHVRNACRPMTTSHPPDFKYYFVSFRCCADAKGAPPFQPRGAQPAPKVEPADRAPSPEPVDPPGPSKKKVPRENDWKGPPKKTTKPR
jgi:formylglycine-generating enzyme required for sulfatase activity